MRTAALVIFSLLILVGSCRAAVSFTKLWTFDLLNLTTTTTHPELVDLHFDVVRLGRGRIGFNGFVDMKTDFDDDVIVHVTVQRSLKKEGPYGKLPFIVDNEMLTNAMNRYYKFLIMPTAEKCSVNAPIFKGKFVPPLTKRFVEFNSCVMSTDDMPSIMMEGYYWVTITLRREFELNVYILSFVEHIF